MGNNIPGYLGKQGADASNKRQYYARRKVLPGYPVEEPFTNVDSVKEYLSGDRIICLLCGKPYRRIGTHIQIVHDITVDEYKQKYNIPWTYGLICDDSSQLYRDAAIERIKNGEFVLPLKYGEVHKKMVTKKRRSCPFQKDIAISNLGEHTLPKHPLTPAPNGELETFSQKRERLTAKKGTSEYHKKMQTRPQCAAFAEKYKHYWTGKKRKKEI